MAGPQLPDTDVQDAFLAGRTQAKGAAAQNDWQQMLREGGYGGPAAGGAAPLPTAASAPPQPGATATAQASSVGAPGAPTQPTKLDYMGQPVPAMLPSAASIAAKIGHGAMSVAKDMASGFADAPRQIAGGLLDFYNNLHHFADDVERTMADSPAGDLPGAITLFGKDGKWAPRIWSEKDWIAAKDSGEAHEYGGAVPTTGSPDTVTGNVIRTATTFIAGRGGSASGGLVANLGRDFASGALMDPAQPRLSNVVDQVAPNFATDWLKADPADQNKLLERVKSGLEYAGLGAAFEGVKRAALSLKDAVGAEGAPAGTAIDLATNSAGPGQNEGRAKAAMGGSVPQEGEAAPAAPATPTPPDRLPLGDPSLPVISSGLPHPLAPAEGAPAITPEIASQAKSFLEGTGGDNPIKLNLSRIGSGQDIEMALRQVSSMLPDDLVQSNEMTKQLAQQLGLKPEDFLRGYQGGGLSAAETTGMRFMLDSSAKQLVEYANAATADGAAPEDMARFLKAFSTHRALQQYAENARAEAGRTLQSWSILSQTQDSYSSAIKGIVDQVGIDDMKTVARQVADLGTSNPNAVSPYVAMLRRMSGRDAIVYGFQNMLLSPTTIGRKLATDIAMPVWNTVTRFFAEKFGSGAVPEGETAQMAYGYVSSLKDAVKLAGKAIATGRSDFMRSGAEMEDPAAISRAFNGVPGEVSEQAPQKSAMELLKYVMPTTYVGAVDDAASYTHYNAQKLALAYRDAVGKGLQGDDLSAAVRESAATPPSWLHEAAKSYSQQATFKEDLTPWASKLAELVDSANVPIPHTQLQLPVGRMVVPFVKIPFNLTAWTFRNTPIGLTYAGSQIRQALEAGGAERDLAIAKMTLGSALATTMGGLALHNVITGRGPSDPQARRMWLDGGGPDGTKAQPYSFYVGGTGYSMAPEPFANMAGMIADSINVMRFAKDRDAEQAAFSAAFGMGHALMSRTYFEGISNLFEGLDNPDANSKQYFEQLASSFVVPGTMRDAANSMDDFYRMHYDLLDKLEVSSGIGRQDHPALQNFWGDPIPMKQGYFPLASGTFPANMLSPMKYDPSPEAEPIDKWVWDNRAYFNPDEDPNGGKYGMTGIGWHVTFASGASGVAAHVMLTDDALFRYRQLAGNEAKLPMTGLGAKDTLNGLVQDNLVSEVNPRFAGAALALQRDFDNASPEKQALMVQHMVMDARKIARVQLLAEYPDLRDAVQDQWNARAEALTQKPQ